MKQIRIHPVLIEQKNPYLDETDSENVSAILWILSDSYCRAIIRNIKDIPKSCTEVSAECKIPISTVYRRMQHLQDRKLVHVSGMISSDGKKYFLYKSKIKSINVLFDDELTVNALYS